MAPPTIRIITDGKIGDLVQCRGVASRLTTSECIEEFVVKPDWFHALPLPFMPVQKSDRPGLAGSPLAEPFPDLVLASGRRTIPYLHALRRARRNARSPVLVFLKDPRMGRGAADFVWAPVHDRLSGDDVLSTHTSPHGFTSERLNEAAEAARERFAHLPKPLVGVVLGGDSGSVKWTEDMATDFANALAKRPDIGAFVVTPSRRTPDVLKRAVANALSDRPNWIWDETGDNPYVQILTGTDGLIVTGDSHNMVSESLVAGVPVAVYRPQGLQKKLHTFLDAMAEKGAICDLTEFDTQRSGIRVDATDEIAKAIAKLI